MVVPSHLNPQPGSAGSAGRGRCRAARRGWALGFGRARCPREGIVACLCPPSPALRCCGNLQAMNEGGQQHSMRSNWGRAVAIHLWVHFALERRHQTTEPFFTQGQLLSVAGSLGGQDAPGRGFNPHPIPFVALVGVPPVPADQRTNGVRWALLPRLLGPLDFLRRCRRCRHRRPRCCINVRLQILEIPCISCGCAQPAGHSPTPNRQRHVLGPPSRHATMARERISAWETP